MSDEWIGEVAFTLSSRKLSYHPQVHQSFAIVSPSMKQARTPEVCVMLSNLCHKTCLLEQHISGDWRGVVQCEAVDQAETLMHGRYSRHKLKSKISRLDSF